MIPILIVDDHPENRYLLRMMLRGHDYSVEEASHGAEALQRARISPPALIISDLLMPTMDGFTLLRHWKSDPRLAQIPFVVYSATYTDPQDENLALEFGADAFIAKPVEVDVFLACIHDVLQRPPRAIAADRSHPSWREAELLREYNQVLIRKLERKTRQLEQTNRELLTDIADRRLTEESLRRTSTLLSAVADSTTDSVFVKDRQGRYLLFNPAAANFVGKQINEVLGRDDTALFGPDDAKTVMSHDQLVMQSGQNVTREEELTANGTTRTFLATKAPYRDGEGNVVGIVGISRDITDRKRAENALREKEAELAEAVRLARMGYWSRDLNTNQLEWSSTLFEILGVPPTDGPPSLEEFLQMVHPDDRSHVNFVIDRAIHNRGSFEQTYRIVVGGQIRYLQEVGRVISDANGEAIRVSGTARDVTDETTAEMSLRASENRYRQLADAMPQIVWVAQPNGRFEFYNQQWCDFTGLTYEVTRGDLWSLALHPEDQQVVRERWKRSLSTGEPFEIEYRCRRYDGQYEWFLGRALPQRDEVGEIICWFGTSTNVHDFKRTEEALQLRDRAINAATQGILITDPTQTDNPIVYVSPGFERLTGYSSEEAVGRNCRFLQCKETDPDAIRRVRKAIMDGVPCTVQLLNSRKDGSTFWNELSISPVCSNDGKVTHFVGVQVDVTAKRNLEEQFQQAQKMEAIGQLAGGVAHDFNNLLTIITGYSELLLESTAHVDPRRELIEEIRKAGERSAALTRQLLVFSRKQVLAPRILDLNMVIRDTEKLLHRVIGEDIQLSTVLSEAEKQVRADPGQLEQVLLNLAVNARDAMPQGGRLTIETACTYLDANYAENHLGIRPGEYVQLSVSDTGTGMSEEVKRRVFEPFFTTKAQGKGTGLGLAVVHGIIRQSEGSISVYSEQGIGTTFKIYFPCVESTPSNGERVAALGPVPHGKETILLVEDDRGVRELAKSILIELGYVVMSASRGSEATVVANDFRDHIHLLITDVVMPDEGGRLLANRLLEIHPEMKVLYVSGYTDDAIVRHGILHDEVNFLQKPFTPVALAHKVRQVLAK